MRWILLAGLVLLGAALWLASLDFSEPPLRSGAPDDAVKHAPELEARPQIPDAEAQGVASRVPSRVLRFRVVTAVGVEPIAEAKIEVGTLVGRTDAEGNATLPLGDRKRPGGFSCRISHPDFRTREVEHATPETLNQVRLEFGHRVTGRVVQMPGEIPVEGATVRAWRIRGRKAVSEPQTTDAEGAFSLKELPDNEALWVVASAPGFHPVAWRGTLREEIEPLTLRVGGGGRIHGRVTDADGVPTPDVDVWLLRPGLAVPPRREPRQWFVGGDHEALRRFYYPRVRTDAQGRYAFAGISLDQPRTVAVVLGTFAAIHSDRLTLTDEQREIVHDVATPRLAQVRLLTVGPDGNPDPGIQVNFESEYAWQSISNEIEPDADGVRLVRGLLPGPWRLRIWPPGQESESQGIELAPGEVRDFVFRARPGKTLRGRVVDPAGVGVHLAIVQVAGSGFGSVMTDRSGYFEQHGLSDVPLQVEILHIGSALRTSSKAFARLRLEDVRAGGPLRTYTLPYAGYLQGRFVGMAEGAVYEHELHTVEGSRRGGKRKVPKGAAYRWPLVHAETPMVLVIRNTGTDEVYYRRIPSLSVGQDHAVGEVRLTSGRTLQGRILDPEGNPPRTCVVRAFEGWIDDSVNTDARGKFQIAGLPEFPVRLRIDMEGHPPIFRTVDPSRTSRLTLRAAAVGTLAVHVLDKDGRKLPELSLGIRPVVESTSAWISDDTWLNYRRRGEKPAPVALAPGRYVVSVSDPGSTQSAMQEVEVRSGAATQLELRLTPIGN